jgi:hypothetical protein
MRKEISEENLTSSCLSRYDTISDILDKRTRSSLSLSQEMAQYVHQDLGALGVRGEHRKQDHHVHTSLDTSSLWGSPCVHITMGITQCARVISLLTSILHVTWHVIARETTHCTRHVTCHPFGIPTIRGFDATLGAVGCILGKVRPWREAVLGIRA